MGNRWCIVVPITFLLAGCSTVTSKRTNNLETKVGALEAKVNSVEQRQSAIEGQTGESRESVGYLKEKAESVGPSVVKKSLTHKDIQLALKNAGFYNGPIDGKIGKNSKKAIREFQKVNGLKADGIIGKNTKSLLIQYLTQETK